MATEDTELTFVRCPSCRSLVPAVATRCRMCGHHFDGETSEAGENSGARKGRVRQRSMSTTPGEAEEIRKQLRDTNGNGSHASTDSEQKGELDVKNSSDNIVEPTLTEDEPSLDVQEEMPADYLEDSFEEDEAGEDAREDAIGDAREDDREDDGEDEREDEGGTLSGSEEDSYGEGRKRKRRRRRKRRGGGTQFEGSNTVVQDRPDFEKSPRFQSDVKESFDVSGIQTRFTKGERIESMATTETNETIASAVTTPARSDISSGQRPPQPARHQGQQPHVAEEGLLVGWFVNYEQDSRGVALEIRSGKYFIARQRLRGHDLVIADSAISTPHCLVSASKGDGLRVQDLMSEQGTHIKKRGSENFSKVQDAVVVEHGDSLRFGAYEVTVCLVPFGQRR